MQCPVCDDRMKEVERSGVSIDICPGCKGVWLDRGELDKLIELAQQPGMQPGAAGPQAFAAPRAAGPGVAPGPRDYGGFGGHGDHGDDRHREHGHDHDHDHDREHDHERPRFGFNEHDRGHGDPQHRKRSSWLGDLFGGDD